MNGEIRHNILIVSGTKAGVQSVRDLLPQDSAQGASFALCAAAAREALQKRFDIVIVDTPLPDEFGDALAELVTGRGASGAVLLVEDGSAEAVQRAEAGGTLVLEKPVSKAIFRQALRLLTAMQNRWYRLNSENEKLQTQMEEIRIVSRAKYILMEYLRMSEQQAHRYIEKQAMDMRASKRSIAERILKTYD